MCKMAAHKSQTVFFDNNPTIKWMPLILANKTPVGINHECYKRMKITDGTITYTPNFTEFKTISHTTLKERQTLFESLPYRGIDTYEIAQIDIDTPNVNKIWLDAILKETPYYKSLTKKYGYHIFVKITDDFTPTKITYHFKSVIPPNDEYNEPNGYRICPDEDQKKIELLTGKWGYIKTTTKIYNADKPILSILNITDCLIDYEEKKNKIIRNEPPPPYTQVEEEEQTQNTTHYIKTEINEHMLNIKQEYIDNYSDHIKIITAILKTGYEDIAKACMFRSSNTKNKNLNEEFYKFKQSKLYDITPATLFHYSKQSNKEQFFKINQKYQYYQLREQARLFFFNLENITEIINKQYLPKNLITKYLKNETDTIIHIQSPMGTGKTTMMKHFLEKYQDESVLYISPRRTFSNDVFTDLCYCDFNHYLNLKQYKKANNNEIPKRIICQVESLFKLKDQSYNIVIIDEIESDLTQLVSPTNAKYLHNHYLFERFIKHAKKVITMDAFLTGNSQRIINEIKPNTLTYTIQNIYKSKQNWTAYEVGKLKDLFKQAVGDIEEGKKIVFVSSVKKVAYKFIEKLPKNTKYKIYTGDSGDKEKQFKNIEEEWGNLDVLIYTGVITCGVSFDPIVPYYESIYCYVSPSGSSARDIQQAKERVRKFKTTNLYFCVDKTSYAYEYDNFYADNYAELEKYERERMKERDSENGILNELPKWAFKNHMFSIYTTQINQLYQLALFCEYLRFQGYTIIYADYTDGKILDGAKFISSCNVYEKSNLTPYEYEQLEKRCYDLTEEEKQKIKCYLFEVCMKDIITNVDYDTISILYKNFNSDERMRLFNVMFRPEVYNNNLEREWTDGERITNLTTSIDRKRYEKINELSQILGCRKIYELDYTTDTLCNKQKEIMDWIDKNKHFFNFRDTRGDGSIKYMNSIIKKISEVVGLNVESKCSSKYENKEKKTVYKYTNYKNKKGELVKLYEIYKTLE